MRFNYFDLDEGISETNINSQIKISKMEIINFSSLYNPIQIQLRNEI